MLRFAPGFISMEQQQRSLIFTAAVGLIILAIIVGSIYYLVKFIQGRVATNSTPIPAATEIAEDFAVPSSTTIDGGVMPASSAQGNQIPSTGNSQPAASAAPSDKKIYDGGNFQMAYPKNWGLLKCSNSLNIEFDPANGADTSIACDTATKPVTVIVSDVRGCEGQTTKIGNVDVVKVQESEAGDNYYQWCTKTTPVLNISHRVSPQVKTGFSTQDFSRQIEEMIASLSFSRGS
jgi:hypothetical protein